VFLECFVCAYMLDKQNTQRASKINFFFIGTLIY